VLLKFQTASIPKIAHIQKQKSQVRNQHKQNIKKAFNSKKHPNLFYFQSIQNPKLKKTRPKSPLSNHPHKTFNNNNNNT